jgi:hypothetical protein
MIYCDWQITHSEVMSWVSWQAGIPIHQRDSRVGSLSEFAEFQQSSYTRPNKTLENSVKSEWILAELPRLCYSEDSWQAGKSSDPQNLASLSLLYKFRGRTDFGHWIPCAPTFLDMLAKQNLKMRQHLAGATSSSHVIFSVTMPYFGHIEDMHGFWSIWCFSVTRYSWNGRSTKLIELVSNKHISSISWMKYRYVGGKYIHFMTANKPLVHHPPLFVTLGDE